MKSSNIIWLCLLALIWTASPIAAAQHTAGLGAGYAPDYEGSEDYQGVPMVMLRGHYDSGRFFALVGTNLKVNLLADKTYSLGPVLNYRMGRDDVDNNQVDDMRDIDDALEAGVFGGVKVDNWLFGLELLADVTDEHDGMTIQADAGYQWKVSKELMITPGIFTTWADDDYMDTYFGVNSKNRGSSTLPDYEADSGIKDFGAKVVANYTPWEKWGIMGIFTYKTLLNDAEDSPIVDDEGDDGQMFLGVMATYRWGSR